jgi:hypothetical protein
MCIKFVFNKDLYVFVLISLNYIHVDFSML